ncbi:MAG TPA: excinuclease ABC subunit UvrC [Capillimicrobium sp.]|nr:excinuclease ABC subunit UvrC [Capillimicrobium sp.]
MAETGARVHEQRRHLPDGPGVYLFHDAKGKVIYVGKAKSLKKRVASHFSNPVTRGAYQMTEEIDSVDYLLVASEAEALLVEQNFIKQYQPRFNIRLRDDKSYPFIAISMEEEFPRVYFTRERHRRNRLYFGPYSNAKRVRGTLDLLGKVFQFRSCQGPEPGRRSGSPCLDYYIKRCGAPCVGYVDRDGYMEAIDGVIAFLSGRYREIERDLEARMRAAAEAQEYEQAALERNRLNAVRSLLERQRVANESVGTLDAVAVAVQGTDANAQVFQVRDGVLSDRQSFYLSNEGERDLEQVVEEFVLQYYAEAMSIPAQILVQSPVDPYLGEALAERRGGKVEFRVPERGDKRRILDLAERNAKLALDQEKLKTERRRQQRVEALDGLQQALALDALPLRIECYDISNLMGTHQVASMVVFEGGAPKKSDYRRFRIRGNEEGVPDDFAAMAEVLGRRLAQWERQADLSPHDPEYDPSFAALPNLVVIDGGPGQLSAGLSVLQGFRDRGVAVISLAKRIEEVFRPGVREPLRLAHDTPELQLLQRVRDEAHRFAITHHRGRRDRAMTSSVLDDLPGIGPTRKRAILKHFGSPEAFLAASREELEAVPGLPGKVARDLWTSLHKTGV